MRWVTPGQIISRAIMLEKGTRYQALRNFTKFWLKPLETPGCVLCVLLILALFPPHPAIPPSPSQQESEFSPFPCLIDRLLPTNMSGLYVSSCSISSLIVDVSQWNPKQVPWPAYTIYVHCSKAEVVHFASWDKSVMSESSARLGVNHSCKHLFWHLLKCYWQYCPFLFWAQGEAAPKPAIILPPILLAFNGVKCLVHKHIKNMRTFDICFIR